MVSRLFRENEELHIETYGSAIDDPSILLNRFPMFPFVISAPSMVFGMDLIENVKRLSSFVKHVEIVLFHTPELDNIPAENEIRSLKELKAENDLTYSVHLPASLEIAEENGQNQNSALRTITEIIATLQVIDPLFYILHVPLTKPTLAFEPGCYFTRLDQYRFTDWTTRAITSLQQIQIETGLDRKLLVENINYSPIFLEPFWREGLCGLCLDIGHLLLGNESVGKTLKQYLPVIREIHLHGVIGCDEHLSLNVMPTERVQSWFQHMKRSSYNGLVNLEVFSPDDLETSLGILERLRHSWRTLC